MKAVFSGIFWMAATAGVSAQVVTGSLQASHDSDSFNEKKLTTGYSGSVGWGFKVSTLHYDNSEWSESGALLAVTYKKKDTRRQVNASLGVAQVAHKDYLVGDLDYMEKLLPSTAAGLSIERNFVDSVLGIQKGVSYSSVAMVLDHEFTDRFNVGVVLGSTFFSNENRRPIFRTRWNYSLAESYGLNAFIKTRIYRNSSPYRAEYFSPEQLVEASLGLSSRFVVAETFVLSASMDAGQQRIDSESQPIWSASLGVASPRARKIQWMVGVEASNSASLFTSQAASYRYVSAVANINIPF